LLPRVKRIRPVEADKLAGLPRADVLEVIADVRSQLERRRDYQPVA
jgi:hypothetical protein